MFQTARSSIRQVTCSPPLPFVTISRLMDRRPTLKLHQPCSCSRRDAHKSTCNWYHIHQGNVHFGNRLAGRYSGALVVATSLKVRWFYAAASRCTTPTYALPMRYVMTPAGCGNCRHRPPDCTVHYTDDTQGNNETAGCRESGSRTHRCYQLIR
jgi:hypothetical protein